MIPLSEKCVDKVRKLIPRLASIHDGEVIATARAIEKTLKTHGVTYHELSAAIVCNWMVEPRRPEPRQEKRDESVDGGVIALMVRDAAHELLRMKWLNERETEFVTNMVRKAMRPGTFKMTARQWEWFKSLCETYGVQL